MPAFPVSVKGVVARAGRTLLLHNERDEWELPGGRLELGETPEQCVVREIHEETGWQVRPGPILDSWLYYIEAAERHVFIVTYGCLLVDDGAGVAPVVSSEHTKVGLFARDEIDELPMPDGYKRSVSAWYEQWEVSADNRGG